MMRQYELVERVKRYNPAANEDLLNRAYVYAMRAHGTQKRASGDPFFAHPLEVAAILTDLRLDDATIIAAVLHDTVEDTSATLDEIGAIFGPEIGALVDGLTKLKKLDLVSKRAAQGENFRKLLLAVAADVRVLLVKLADRLHNMRTLHHMIPEKRERIGQETLDIYAPLAGRMGMQELRDELEDLAFRNMKPEIYKTITQRLADLSLKSERLVESIENDLTAKLAARGIAAAVTGRRKRPFSIWSKMERKSVAFEQLSDIFGFRIVVDSTDACYAALGVVHTTWPMVPGRYKDYISTPKQNDYRSIHTTVIGPKSQRVELQIRTEAMDEIAEYGIAAHAHYKESAKRDDPGGVHPRLATESGAYQWLRRTIELLAEGDSPEEFLEHTKLELFQDQVFCFTPKGRLIALPRGATPIDFAYAVHTDVGNTAVGAKINGRMAPLLHELTNGDEVEIARSDGQSPPAAWESLVVTGKARSAIRRATRSAVRRQYAGLGRQILDRAFERAAKSFTEDKLRAALPRLARLSTDDVFAAVGRGEMFSGDVVKAVYPDYKDERRTGSPGTTSAMPLNGAGRLSRSKDQTMRITFPGAQAAGTPASADGSDPAAIPIRGLDGDLPVSFAPNGGAVPGDRIVGILTPGIGVTIYPIQSQALAAFDNEPARWLDVRWEVEAGSTERFPARLALQSINEPGTLAQIAQVIADHDGNIDNVSMKRRTADFTDIVIDLAVWDLQHLTAIVQELRAKRAVSRVDRITG
ncbi:RelA/SpoT family protein [Methylobacterium sp. sgz302541]|uniref:RelA/SpoT family protein n=1 Tax=unclassified Methylobacterium TaxID=2615210 RepID=UPI003D33EFCA